MSSETESGHHKDLPHPADAGGFEAHLPRALAALALVGLLVFGFTALVRTVRTSSSEVVTAGDLAEAEVRAEVEVEVESVIVEPSPERDSGEVEGAVADTGEAASGDAGVDAEQASDPLPESDAELPPPAAVDEVEQQSDRDPPPAPLLMTRAQLCSPGAGQSGGERVFAPTYAALDGVDQIVAATDVARDASYAVVRDGQACELVPISDPDCPAAPDPERLYQVKRLDPGPLRARSSPTTVNDANIVSSLASLSGPIRFSTCIVGLEGRSWWTFDGAMFVAADFIEPLAAMHDCRAGEAPAVGADYRVSAAVPEDDPLNVRFGPGEAYEPPLTALPRYTDGLRFLGCTRSVEGGPWWLLEGGGYVAGRFLELEP